MDFYHLPEWREQHSQIAVLYDRVCPKFDPLSWKVLFTQQDEVWYCLTRGIFGNPDGFYLAWGPHKSELTNLLSRENNQWFVDSQLSGIVKRAQEDYHIDLLAFPLESWQEKVYPCRCSACRMERANAHDTGGTFTDHNGCVYPPVEE